MTEWRERMSGKVLQIQPGDDVVVALSDLHAGAEIAPHGRPLRVLEDVKAKHKIAVRAIDAGEPVRMYGVVVGRTLEAIPEGGLLTRHNIRHEAAPYEVRAKRVQWTPPETGSYVGRTFRGYHRSDGRVGTANHWLVIPMVFCENRNVEALRHALVGALGYERRDGYVGQVQDLVAMYRSGTDVEAIRSTIAVRSEEEARTKPLFPNVDGIKFLTHGGGCGGTRDDADALCALLAAYIDHPNVAGATVFSLGCQNAQRSMLEDHLATLNPGFDKPLVVVEQQRSGTERRMMTEAISRTFAGLIEANELVRAPAPLDRLVFGVECGGSDGFSGISANPAVGHAADLLVALGGSVILSEFPELCGVEQELIDRCTTLETAERFALLQRTYARRAEAVGAGFDMNPSPGNIRDGLLTDAMKSAGAARKGGTSPVVDVLDYPERVRRSGLNLLCTPGNDVESTTALAAAGANVILFTTGLGTPTGNPIVPVVKISSNSALADHMPDIIDIDSGPVLTGAETIADMGLRIFDHTLHVASGDILPAAVRLGQDDFLPWKRGISL